MKSNLAALQKRGFASKKDCANMQGLPVETLLACMQSSNPVNRTAAVKALPAITEQTTCAVLEQLCKEKSLYTKIALCAYLETGNQKTAEHMVPLLGRIGKNQYTALPAKVSAKKSYPLPRDIIARSLGKMSPAVFPSFLHFVETANILQLRELIDAIGFMVFYNKELATTGHLTTLLSLPAHFPQDTLLLWKMLTCLSAFPLPESIAFLTLHKESPGLFGAEAARSLALLSSAS